MKQRKMTHILSSRKKELQKLLIERTCCVNYNTVCLKRFPVFRKGMWNKERNFVP